MNELRSFSVGEPVATPIAVVVAVSGMLVITAGVVIRLTLIAIASPAEASATARVVVMILGSIVLAFIPALSMWAVRLGWK